MTRVLLLAGTVEARRIAAALMAQGGFHVIASLAGVTTQPARLGHEQRRGGFGGAEGLQRYIADARIDLLVDATHPFAAQMKSHAAHLDIPVTHVIRPAWTQREGDVWIDCSDLPDAARKLPPNARAFLALGQRHLQAFKGHPAKRLIRSVEAMDDRDSTIDVLRGAPGDLTEEMSLLQAHRITHLVCRNAGGRAGHAKIQAARSLGLPVLMVRRPPPPAGQVVQTVEDAVDWCRRHALPKQG